MTERRFKGFTSSIDYHIVEDTLENRYLSKEDVINALNKFWVQYEYYEKENKQLKKELDKLKLVNEMLSMDFSNSEHELWRENKQLKKDLIDHSALISMLEDYQALKIEETLWNLTDAKSEEEFNELYEPYLEKAKRCWR